MAPRSKKPEPSKNPQVQGDSRGAPTRQQAQAIGERGVSVVLSSGAGCGKTHVLTERYLANLREGMEVSQMAAITFTDRAARQMRDRIRRAIMTELRRAETDPDIERWTKHLRALQSAQISTIHSFCTSLLRQHAVVAGLDPNFEVLDEVMAANLRADALNRSLQRLLIDPTEIGEDLRELILLYGWRPTITMIEGLLLSGEEPGWKLWADRKAGDIASAWLGKDRASLLASYVAYLVAANPKISRCLNLLRSLECVGPLTKVHVALLLEETPRLGEAKDLAVAVKTLTEAAKVGKERANAWQNEDDYEAVKAAFTDFRGELPKSLQLFMENPENLPEAVVAGQRFVRVAQTVVRAYRARKRQEGVLDFHDLLGLARDLLHDHSEVREALQDRYQHLLIDELQDTDPVQMQLVESLCGVGLKAGKLFAVGDHKQSIYRFRGADVSQFQNLRLGMPTEGQLGLTVNFRSQPAILDFVNVLFQEKLVDYEPLQAHKVQLNQSSCTEFLWSPRPEKAPVSESRTAEADGIARRIAQMVHDEERLVTDNNALRPVRQGDVVLLFRAMSNVSLYEAALRRHGLDYYLVGGRAFFAQQEIYDLLNVLRALENPQDAVSLAGTLRSPFCCLSDEALYVLARHDKGLWAGLHDSASQQLLPVQQRPIVQAARSNLDRWRLLKDRLSIARLLAAILDDSGYDAALQFEFLGDRKLANLWKLMEMAREFDRSGIFGLADFIDRLGDMVESQPKEEQAATQPESANVVRLMSIHQAKGLEFPIVIVPDMNAKWGGPRLSGLQWDARLGCVVKSPADEDPPPFSEFGWELWKAREEVEDWHEDLRTLYVACTRAEDYLILSSAMQDTLDPENAWMLALAERFDLKTGACLAKNVPVERVPSIRVTDILSATREPTTSQAKKPHSTQSGEHRNSQAWPHEVEPCSVHIGSSQVLTTAALERFMHRREKTAMGKVPDFRSWELAKPFDAEDGSDRRKWQTPRASLNGCGGDAEKSLATLWDVLARWDFADPEGWRERDQPQEIEALLKRFSQSTAFREQHDQARVRLRDVEFLVNLDSTAAKDKGPAICGVIDWLWQDDNKKWHILLLVNEDGSTVSGGQTARVLLAALAVRQQTGDWPASMISYQLTNGSSSRWTAEQLQDPAWLREVQKAVSDLGRLTLCE